MGVELVEGYDFVGTSLKAPTPDPFFPVLSEDAPPEKVKLARVLSKRLGSLYLAIVGMPAPGSWVGNERIQPSILGRLGPQFADFAEAKKIRTLAEKMINQDMGTQRGRKLAIEGAELATLGKLMISLSRSASFR